MLHFFFYFVLGYTIALAPLWWPIAFFVFVVRKGPISMRMIFAAITIECIALAIVVALLREV